MTPFPPSAPLLAPLGPWFEQVRRSLPWRATDLDAPHPDPYGVLVSEIMLQQTQVATVIPYFRRWMERFPTLESLAQAGEDEIHGLWAGLGYYRRARNLQAAAKVLAREGWPGDLQGLLALPGLGPYTAAALGAQAFQWPTPALDGNAFRVSARLLALEEDPRRAAAPLRLWLEPALRAHGPSRMTQAIMELGATVCVPQPQCPRCPLQDRCQARMRGLTDRIPPALPRPKPREVDLLLAAIRGPEGYLLRHPAAKGLLAGLWSWPALEIPEARPSAAAEPRVPYALLAGHAYPGWTQVYSHRRERIHPLALETPFSRPAPPGMAWIPARDLPGIPLGRRDQRLRELLDAQASILPLDDGEVALAMSLLG